MIYKIYGLRDRLTGFTGINLDVNDEAASRGFQLALSGDVSVIGFRPGDFELCRLGTFDTVSGKITVEDVPELIVRGDMIKGEDTK